MDNMFQLRQDMNKEQLQQFAYNSLLKEQSVEDYMLKREERLGMSSEDLQALYAKKEVSRVNADMPKQNADEKEWKQKRRQKNRLKDQVKELEKNHKEREEKFNSRGEKLWEGGKPDAEAMAMFEQTIDVTKLSPQYVLEHFVEVRQMLDDWKGHLRLFGDGGIASDKLSMDQEFRIPLMSEMYHRSEQAFQSALAAMGFRYEESEQGGGSILDNVTEEEKKAALAENMRLREEIGQEAATMDDKVADQLIASEQERLHSDIVRMRQDMSADPKFAFIHSQHLSNPYQYEAIEDVKSKMEGLIKLYPDRYAAHKAEIDWMYEEFFRLMEVNGVYQEPSTAITSMQFDTKKVSSKKLGKLLTRRADANNAKMMMIRDRADYIKAGIMHLLRGDALTETGSLVVREYMQTQDQREWERMDAEAQAGTYADIYREKKAIFDTLAEDMFGDRAQEIIGGEAGRYMMLMEPGQEVHNREVLRAVLARKIAGQMARAGAEEAAAGNREVGRLMKPLILPYLERMRDFDTKELEHCTDEELIARNEELQELDISWMQVSDAAKYPDPDDPQGRSIKEAFLGGDASAKALFTLKSSTVQAYALKARTLSMVKAYEKGVLTESCFIGEELRRMKSRCGLKEEEPLNMNQMLAFAKEKLTLAKSSQDVAYNSFFKTKEAYQRYVNSSANIDTAHPEYMQELDNVTKRAQEVLGIQETPEQTDLERYYRICKDRAAEIEREMEGADEADAAQLQTELTELTRQMEMIQIQHALTRGRYCKVDDIHSPLGEAIFRSYDSVESLPAFRNMSEEEFRDMCVRLSAGALQEDASVPERFDQYYEDNKEGLLIYKAHMRQHYEMLEERFHHRVPSVEYILEHKQEMSRLFANVQVDTHMVTGMRDLFDLTNPEDLRLYHLVLAYNAIGGYVEGLPVMASHMDSNMDFGQVRDSQMNLIRQEQASIDYLDQEHALQEPDLQAVAAEFAEVSQTVQARKQELAQKVTDDKAGAEAARQEIRRLAESYRGMCTEGDKDEFTQIGKALADYDGCATFNVKSCDSTIAALQRLKAALERYQGVSAGEGETEERRALAEQIMEKTNAQLTQVQQLRDAMVQEETEGQKMRTRLEKLQSPLMVERFRQLAADAEHIVSADQKTQITFMQRVMELGEYIEQYRGESSVFLTQFEGWFEFAKKRIRFMAQAKYRAVQGLPGDGAVLDNKHVFVRALESNDPRQFLDAIFEKGKMSSLLQMADITTAQWRSEERKESWQQIEEAEDLALERLNTAPKEFQQGFVNAYYEKMAALAEGVQQEINKTLGNLPAEIAAEDKVLYATFLVSQTQLGRDYIALTDLKGSYSTSESVAELMAQYKRKHEEALGGLTGLNHQMTLAIIKYRQQFEKLGYTQAVDDMHLREFQEEFQDKEAIAHAANKQADSVSYDILRAQNRAKERAGRFTIEELAEKLSALDVTKEMWEPDYMIAHMDELLLSFEVMDAYKTMVENNPALESELPDLQKMMWTNNRALYTRYRDYVTKFARSHCVDVVKGKYLSEESYEAEKEELQQDQTSKKEELRDLVSGFGSYAQKVDAMAEQISGMKKLKKADKADVLKPLRETGLWLADLTRYLNQPLVLSDEDFFDMTIVTLMSMFGYIEKDLRTAGKKLSDAKGAGDVSGLLEQMKQISGTFAAFKERVPGHAQELRSSIVQSGEELPLTLRDIVVGVQDSKTFVQKGAKERMEGGAISEVLKVKEGEKVFFFKEDQISKSLLTNVEAILPILGNDALQQKYLEMIRNEDFDTVYTVSEIMTAMEMGNGFGSFDGYVKALEGYLQTENLADYINQNREEWDRFSKEFQRHLNRESILNHEQLLINPGANLTARNYATERVAEMFGQKNLIIRNREAVLIEENGVQRKGFVMDQAEGIPASALGKMSQELKYKINITGEAQKKLLNLQILDNIIGQVDRHMGNYFVEYDRDDEAKTLTVKNVTGIDNDMSFGQSMVIGGLNTPSILKPIDEKNGKYLPGMIDREMYDALMSVSEELLATNLENVIEPEYLDALKERFKKVKESIRAAKIEAEKNGIDFFRENDGWNEESLKLLKTSKSNYIFHLTG